VWCTASKARTLRVLGLPPTWLALLTRDPEAAGLHVMGGGGVQPEKLLVKYGFPVPAAGGAGGRDGGKASAGGGGAGSGGRQVQGGDDAEADEGEEAEGDKEDEEGLLGAEDAAEESAAARRAGAGRWRSVVGFRPTGWSYRKRGGLSCWRLGAAAVYGVPYSEHSSFKGAFACCACVFASLRAPAAL
jgi:hypothetical protein